MLTPAGGAPVCLEAIIKSCKLLCAFGRNKITLHVLFNNMGGKEETKWPHPKRESAKPGKGTACLESLSRYLVHFLSCAFSRKRLTDFAPLLLF